jgi:predicted ATPase
MRIKSVKIIEHPVLGSFSYGDFDLEIMKKDIATFFVGANGSGKSFFLEAMVEIFQSVLEDKKTLFAFELEIVDKDDLLKIVAEKNKKPIREVNADKNAEDFLPKNILFYYSGDTKRSADYFKSYYEKNKRDTIAGNSSVTIPAFFYIDPSLTQLILLTLLIYQPNFAKSAIWKCLNISTTQELQLIFNEKDWYKTSFKSFPEEASIHFWGARGELSEFCEVLFESSEFRNLKKVVYKHGDVQEEYNFTTGLRINPKDFDLIRNRIKSPKRFFELCVNLQSSELLKEISLLITKADLKKVFNSKSLSEGEKQLLLVLGFLELAQNEKTLFLIDEPDTHLNPLWKYYYMKNLKDVITTNPQDIELFICSHDPLLISGLEAEQVIFVERKNGSISLSKANESLMGKGVEAILTSELFGLATTLDYKTNEKIVRRRLLIAKGINRKLSKQELKELNQLTSELRGIDFTLPYNDPAFVDYLSTLDEDQLTSYTQPFNSANRYEVRQKAKNLFKSKSDDQD